LWEDTTPAPGVVFDIAVKGLRIAAAVVSGSGFIVRAYNVNSGSMEWQDRPTIAPGFRQTILAVELNDDALYAAGRSGPDFGNSEFMVRAYDARSGALLWDDRSHPSTNTAAVDLALGKFRLFVAGYTTDSSTDSDFLIRAYDIRFDTATGP
jgi:hypothetical protein